MFITQLLAPGLDDSVLYVAARWAIAAAIWGTAGLVLNWCLAMLVGYQGTTWRMRHRLRLAPRILPPRSLWTEEEQEWAAQAARHRRTLRPSNAGERAAAGGGAQGNVLGVLNAQAG